MARPHFSLARTSALLSVVGSGALAPIAGAGFLLNDAGATRAIDRQPASAVLPEYTFAYDFVLGTSMELTVRADSPAAALACQRAVLTEIDRLAGVLSTYDPASTISRAMKTNLVTHADLAALLDAYQTWHARTDGALSAHLADVTALWKSAAASGVMPRDADLRAAAQPAGLARLNVDSLGKAYIIDRAVDVARRHAPGGLLNIGGDLRAWGPGAWRIAIRNPLDPADNAAPLATFDLTDAAAATSGGYLRKFTIAGQSFSHVIDARTLRPTATDLGVTVTAGDCLTANALSTAGAILGPGRGSELAAEYGTGFLFAGRETPATDTRGRLSSGLPRRADMAAPAAGAAVPAWPKDFGVNIEVALKQLDGGGAGGPGAGRGGPGGGRGGRGQGRYRRPYVAVWIEDAAGKPVRTVQVWGNSPKYLRDLTGWWKATNGAQGLPRGVTQATRNPGQYNVSWDGLDDAGKPLAKGQYTVVVEISREHGTHVKQTAKIACGGDKPETAKLAASSESDESTVTYGKRGK